MEKERPTRCSTFFYDSDDMKIYCSIKDEESMLYMKTKTNHASEETKNIKP